MLPTHHNPHTFNRIFTMTLLENSFYKETLLKIVFREEKRKKYSVAYGSLDCEDGRSYERKYFCSVRLLAGKGAVWRIQGMACTGYWLWDCSCVWYEYEWEKQNEVTVIFTFIATCHSISTVILGCCCCRFRIPRTKQEIEADYKRKQLAKKFKEKLTLISNADMENMDLPGGEFSAWLWFWIVLVILYMF